MAIEKVVLAAGKMAGEVAANVAPEAAATGVNLLSVAKTGVLSCIPSELKAAVNIGPKNGLVEIAESMDSQILKAKAIELGSRTPYSQPNLMSFPQLFETVQTDTLVIGGGMTGLSVANKLAASGIHTVLVEGARIGERTSQFAGGMITRAGDAGFVDLAEAYGKTTMGQYARGMAKAHDTVMRRAGRLGEKVDFRPTDSHQISYEVGAIDDWMRAERDIVARFDKNITLSAGAKARAIFDQSAEVMTFKGEGQLNPLKYTKELGASAKHAIFEQTPIVGFLAGKAGAPITALTANGGRIEANRVIFATGTGGNLFRNLDNSVEGAQCFAGIAETKAPFTAVGNFFDTDGARRLANGVLRNRNTEGAYNYFRRPADALVIPNAEKRNLVLFGGADKMLPHVPATKTAAELEKQLQEVFPGGKFLHKWSGLIEESKDGMPIIARHAELPQVFGIRGVGGSGIDTSQFVADEMINVLKGGDSILSATRFA